MSGYESEWNGVWKKLTVAPLWSSLWMERAISTCGPWHVDEYDPVMLDDVVERCLIINGLQCDTVNVWLIGLNEY